MWYCADDRLESVNPLRWRETLRPAVPLRPSRDTVTPALLTVPPPGAGPRPVRASWGRMSALHVPAAVRGPHRGRHIPWTLPNVRCRASTTTVSFTGVTARKPPCSPYSGFPQPWPFAVARVPRAPERRDRGHTVAAFPDRLLPLSSFPAAPRGAASLACGPFALVTVTGSAAASVSLALTLPPPPYEDAGPPGAQGRPHVQMFNLIASAQFL